MVIDTNRCHFPLQSVTADFIWLVFFSFQSIDLFGRLQMITPYHPFSSIPIDIPLIPVDYSVPPLVSWHKGKKIQVRRWSSQNHKKSSPWVRVRECEREQMRVRESERTQMRAQEAEWNWEQTRAYESAWKWVKPRADESEWNWVRPRADERESKRVPLKARELVWGHRNVPECGGNQSRLSKRLGWKDPISKSQKYITETCLDLFSFLYEPSSGV